MQGVFSEKGRRRKAWERRWFALFLSWAVIRAQKKLLNRQESMAKAPEHPRHLSLQCQEDRRLHGWDEN